MKKHIQIRSVQEKLIQSYINLKIDAETKKGSLLVEKYRVNGYPTILFLNSNEEILDVIGGFLPPEEFLTMLEDIAEGKNTFISLKEEISKDPLNIKVLEKYFMKLSALEDVEGIRETYIQVYEKFKNTKKKDKKLFEKIFYTVTENIYDDKVFIELYNIGKDYLPPVDKEPALALRFFESYIETFIHSLEYKHSKKKDISKYLDVLSAYNLAPGFLEETAEKALRKKTGNKESIVIALVNYYEKIEAYEEIIKVINKLLATHTSEELDLNYLNWKLHKAKIFVKAMEEFEIPEEEIEMD